MLLSIHSHLHAQNTGPSPHFLWDVQMIGRFSRGDCVRWRLWNVPSSSKVLSWCRKLLCNTSPFGGLHSKCYEHWSQSPKTVTGTCLWQFYTWSRSLEIPQWSCQWTQRPIVPCSGTPDAGNTNYPQFCPCFHSADPRRIRMWLPKTREPEGQ